MISQSKQMELLKQREFNTEMTATTPRVPQGPCNIAQGNPSTLQHRPEYPSALQHRPGTPGHCNIAQSTLLQQYPGTLLHRPEYPQQRHSYQQLQLFNKNRTDEKKMMDKRRKKREIDYGYSQPCPSSVHLARVVSSRIIYMSS